MVPKFRTQIVDGKQTFEKKVIENAFFKGPKFDSQAANKSCWWLS